MKMRIFLHMEIVPFEIQYVENAVSLENESIITINWILLSQKLTNWMIIFVLKFDGKSENCAYSISDSHNTIFTTYLLFSLCLSVKLVWRTYDINPISFALSIFTRLSTRCGYSNYFRCSLHAPLTHTINSSMEWVFVFLCKNCSTSKISRKNAVYPVKGNKPIRVFSFNVDGVVFCVCVCAMVIYSLFLLLVDVGRSRCVTQFQALHLKCKIKRNEWLFVQCHDRKLQSYSRDQEPKFCLHFIW